MLELKYMILWDLRFNYEFHECYKFTRKEFGSVRCEFLRIPDSCTFATKLQNSRIGIRSIRIIRSFYTFDIHCFMLFLKKYFRCPLSYSK